MDKDKFGLEVQVEQIQPQRLFVQALQINNTTTTISHKKQ
jgi:hypothetical protein